MAFPVSSSARAFKLAMFLVSQRDNNAITVVTNELKRVPILAGDFVLEMPPRGNYVDRVVVSSPVHRHTLIGVLFTKYAFDGLLVSSIRAH
jgi:hypothetical protein